MGRQGNHQLSEISGEDCEVNWVWKIRGRAWPSSNLGKNWIFYEESSRDVAVWLHRLEELKPNRFFEGSGSNTSLSICCP
jgi:hypothetical protein